MSTEYKFKGTPGKWQIDGMVQISSDAEIDGNLVCIAPAYSKFPYSSKCWQANAHLIAAAPDLLEALRLFIEWSECKGPHPMSSQQVHNQAKAAIHKALNLTPSNPNTNE